MAWTRTKFRKSQKKRILKV